MAVLQACEQIRDRLAPVWQRLLGAAAADGADDAADSVTFAQVVQTAFFERIDLSAHGYYAVPGDRCGFDFELKGAKHNQERGMPFNYFTYGVACTEVEIDVLTGDMHMVRADILMDLGSSVNPALDIGQIEGAFIQGFGWCTMEELIWGDSDHQWVRPGNLFTQGPGTYKIPSFNDVPLDFRVRLTRNYKNKFAVHSSKAVGEPPLFLGAAAFFATKQAIYEARKEEGLTGHFTLDSPCTSERIRVACTDPFTGGKDVRPWGSF
jgi:xanthine dehydrogenase/oxidase